MILLSKIQLGSDLYIMYSIGFHHIRLSETACNKISFSFLAVDDLNIIKIIEEMKNAVKILLVVKNHITGNIPSLARSREGPLYRPGNLLPVSWILHVCP